MKSNLKLYTLSQAYNLESKDVKKLYKEYSNIKLPSIYYKFSFGKKIFSSAKGSFIYDKNKKKYFDFTGGLGVANFGHNNPNILKARINFQKKNYLEIHKSYLNKFLAAASFNLSKVLGNNLKYVFFFVIRELKLTMVLLKFHINILMDKKKLYYAQIDHSMAKLLVLALLALVTTSFQIELDLVFKKFLE